MAFSRHTVGDQSPSERLCLYPDSGSLTRARNLVRGSHLDVLSAIRGSGSWCQLPRYRHLGSVGLVPRTLMVGAGRLQSLQQRLVKTLRRLDLRGVTQIGELD